jgi:hypothetical protein
MQEQDKTSYAERKMKRALLISAVLLAGPAFGQEALNPVPQASTGATDQRGGELRRQQDTQGAEDAARNARILELQSLDARILELQKKLEALTAERAGQSAQPTPRTPVPTSSPALQGSRSPSVTQATAAPVTPGVRVEGDLTATMPAAQPRFLLILACFVFLLVLVVSVSTLRKLRGIT